MGNKLLGALFVMEVFWALAILELKPQIIPYIDVINQDNSKCRGV